jgi:hypothetical protein
MTRQRGYMIKNLKPAIPFPDIFFFIYLEGTIFVLDEACHKLI